MRDDRVYLRHILECMDAIASYTGDGHARRTRWSEASLLIASAPPEEVPPTCVSPFSAFRSDPPYARCRRVYRVS